MSPPRSPRDRQRGNSLLLALIVMSALAALGSLTVVSMQSSLKTSTNDRAQQIAMYAAESGAAVAMNFLRLNFVNAAQPGAAWSAYVTPSNLNVVSVPQALIPSNDAAPTAPNNLLSPDQNAWFDIQLYNNRDDPGFAAGAGSNDTDGRIVIRTTGHGPQGSLAIIEWEVQRTDYTRGWPSPPAPPFPVQAPPPFTPSPPSWGFTEPLLTPGPVPPAGSGLVLLGWHVVSL